MRQVFFTLSWLGELGELISLVAISVLLWKRKSPVWLVAAPVVLALVLGLSLVWLTAAIWPSFALALNTPQLGLWPYLSGFNTIAPFLIAGFLIYLAALAWRSGPKGAI